MGAFSLFSFSRMDKLVVELTNSSKKTKIEILAKIATKVVTIVGIPSYTSGLQE